MKSASDQAEGDQDDVSYHDVHHYVAIYCLAAAGLAAAVGLGCAYRRQFSAAPVAHQPAISSGVQCFIVCIRFVETMHTRENNIANSRG
ncbi:hypothetical protein K1T71_015293 [Dendrolimus kikuchii]|nr:hypothetical protein K1T71_014933 [Dendrolimus kikuchii]KAJ0169217.1 hypothetical protein K1T71_015293 [Dendrolimus kikuchii]